MKNTLFSLIQQAINLIKEKMMEFQSRQEAQRYFFEAMLLLYEKRNFFKTSKYYLKIYNVFVCYCNFFKIAFKFFKFDMLFDGGTIYYEPIQLWKILNMFISISKKIRKKIENEENFSNLILSMVKIRVYLECKREKDRHFPKNVQPFCYTCF